MQNNDSVEPIGILHFTIGVTDIDRATAFYKDTVGCKLLRQNGKRTMSFMQAGTGYFVLAHTGRHVAPNMPGSTTFHHAFIVSPEDYDKAVESLQSKGVELVEAAGKRDDPNAKHNSFPGRHVYFFDPDGNGVEITDCTGHDA